MARQFGRVQATGSYIIGGRSGRSLRGLYKQLSGTTMRVASSRLDGHTFQLNRTPSLSSFCCINSWYVVIMCSPENKKYMYTKDSYTFFIGTNNGLFLLHNDVARFILLTNKQNGVKPLHSCRAPNFISMCKASLAYEKIIQFSWDLYEMILVGKFPLRKIGEWYGIVGFNVPIDTL